MTNRCTLHYKHLGNFVLWCTKNGIETATPTGEWQVLKVRIGDAWDAVYIKQSATRHFSVSDRLARLVRRFLADVCC